MLSSALVIRNATGVTSTDYHVYQRDLLKEHNPPIRSHVKFNLQTRSQGETFKQIFD